MPIVKLETLSPIHIGSGRSWQANFDYLLFPKEACLAVLDDKKILNIIGQDNLDEWVRLIDAFNSNRPDTIKDFLQRFRPNLKAEDISSHIIPLSMRVLYTKQNC